MIQLSDLSRGMPAITPAFGEYLAQAGAVCLESQGHSQGKLLSVFGKHQGTFPLTWPPITDQMLRCLNDPEEATAHGAVGIAVLLTKKIIGYSVVERSRKGTGFDYWLGESNNDLFQSMARLEVLGIRKGDKASVKCRAKQKLRQTELSDVTSLPAHIVVVEFGQPTALMEAK